jgi:hypothetical protein
MAKKVEGACLIVTNMVLPAMLGADFGQVFLECLREPVACPGWLTAAFPD